MDKSVENIIRAHERNREDAFVVYLCNGSIDWAVKGEQLPAFSVVLEVHAWDGNDWNAIVLHDSGVDVTANATLEAYEHFNGQEEEKPS